MKNACIVWNHQNNGLRTLDFAPVLDGFRAFGYPVDELRMLSGADNQKLCAAVSALKTEYDNVILITEKAWLDYVKAVLVAGGLFTENAVAVNADGEGIFTDKNKSLFLLYFGASNQFIKSVCMPYLRQKHADRRAKMTVRAVGANAIHVEKLIEKAKSYSGRIRSRRFTTKTRPKCSLTTCCGYLPRAWAIACTHWTIRRLRSSLYICLSFAAERLA